MSKLIETLKQLHNSVFPGDPCKIFDSIQNKKDRDNKGFGYGKFEISREIGGSKIKIANERYIVYRDSESPLSPAAGLVRDRYKEHHCALYGEDHDVVGYYEIITLWDILLGKVPMPRGRMSILKSLFYDYVSVKDLNFDLDSECISWIVKKHDLSLKETAELVSAYKPVRYIRQKGYL